MSENADPFAPQPPEVYRRRRIVALLILVLIVLLIIGLISWLFGRGSGSSDTSAAASASASSSQKTEAFSDFSQRATASASASESASVSASAEPTESASATASQEASPEASASPSASAEPTESASPSASPSAEPTQAALVACTAADLKISLTADRTSYAAGQSPALAVSYTNTSGNPCIVTGGANNVDINITSGPAQVYNYAQCNQVATENAELAAGASQTAAVSWNRTINALGCNSTLPIQPGYYWATASVNGVNSQPVRIIVTG